MSAGKSYILLHNTSSTVTSHLLNKHHIISEKTNKMESNRGKSERRDRVGRQLASQDQRRYYGLSAAIFAATDDISLKILSSMSFRRLFVEVPNFPRLYDKKLKTNLLDLYIFMQDRIRIHLSLLKAIHQMPFL